VQIASVDQHSRIMVHSLACSSLDVVWNACAGCIQRSYTQSTMQWSHLVYHNMPPCRYCADACAQACSTIDALHGNIYTLQRITILMCRHCCTCYISLYVLNTSRYYAILAQALTMVSHQLCVQHACSCLPSCCQHDAQGQHVRYRSN